MRAQNIVQLSNLLYHNLITISENVYYCSRIKCAFILIYRNEIPYQGRIEGGFLGFQETPFDSKTLLNNLPQ